MGKVHGSLARAGKVRNQTPKVAKTEKKKAIVFSDGSKPEKISLKKSEPAAKRPPIGSKKWRTLVDEMAPGHPVPPQSVYNLFRKMAKAEGLTKMEPAAFKVV